MTDLFENERLVDGTIDWAGVGMDRARHYANTGAALALLRHGLKVPTESRPLVYELRITSWPSEKGEHFVVLKGFGEVTPLVAFHRDIGFIPSLASLGARLAAGKVNFQADSYEPKRYLEEFDSLRS